MFQNVQRKLGRAIQFKHPRHRISRMTEYATELPIERRFDPYVQNGGSILGTPLLPLQ